MTVLHRSVNPEIIAMSPHHHLVPVNADGPWDDVVRDVKKLRAFLDGLKTLSLSTCDIIPSASTRRDRDAWSMHMQIQMLTPGERQDDESFRVGIRAYGILVRSGHHTLSDVLHQPYGPLGELPGLGKRSKARAEIIAQLKLLGYKLHNL